MIYPHLETIYCNGAQINSIHESDIFEIHRGIQTETLNFHFVSEDNLIYVWNRGTSPFYIILGSIPIKMKKGEKDLYGVKRATPISFECPSGKCRATIRGFTCT